MVFCCNQFCHMPSTLVIATWQMLWGAVHPGCRRCLAPGGPSPFRCQRDCWHPVEHSLGTLSVPVSGNCVLPLWGNASPGLPTKNNKHKIMLIQYKVAVLKSEDVCILRVQKPVLSGAHQDGTLKTLGFSFL